MNVTEMLEQLDRERAWERMKDMELLKTAYSAITDDLNDLSQTKTPEQLEVFRKRLEHLKSAMQSNLVNDIAEGEKEQKVFAQQTELRQNISKAIDANLVVIANNQKLKVAGYKLDSQQLAKLGELLAKYDFIRKTDVHLFAKMQGGMQWNRKKKTPRLIYIIRKIREDGKCPYSEMSRIFSVCLRSNTRVIGYDDIDKLINLATT